MFHEFSETYVKKNIWIQRVHRNTFVYIYTCDSERKILCFHLDLREAKNDLIHQVRNLFLRKLQALIAPLDKTRN